MGLCHASANVDFERTWQSWHYCLFIYRLGPVANWFWFRSSFRLPEKTVFNERGKSRSFYNKGPVVNIASSELFWRSFTLDGTLCSSDSKLLGVVAMDNWCP